MNVDDDNPTTGPGRLRRPQQLFFVTCGRGLESFVVKELSSNVYPTTDGRGFLCNIESVHDGKVFFESSTMNVRWLHQQLFNLKSAERIFVCVAYYNSSMICGATADPAPAPRRGRAKSYAFADFVRRTCSDVIADANCRWLDSFVLWSRLQQPPDVMHVVENKNYDVEFSKLRTDKMQNVSPERSAVSDSNCVELHSKRPRLEEQPGSARLRDDEFKQDNAAGATGQITFRISSKSSGFVSRRCPHQTLSRWIAESVERHLPCWTPNLRNPDVEVYVHLNDEFLLIGFPLSRQPLSKRSYLNTIALRSTTCWAMSCAARLKPGDQILDPMCGAGTLIVEAAVCWGVEMAVGIDIDVRQLIASQRNIERTGVQNVVHLAQGLVQNLPLRNDSFDVVLCDYPFGRKFGTLAEAKRLLPKTVLEINRVCKNGGRIVFLLSLELVELLTATVAELFDKQAAKPCISSGRPAAKMAKMVPRSVMAASSYSSKSVANAPNCDVLGASTAASDWKRLSSDRLMLGNLEACIVAHIKRRRSVRH